MLESHPQIHMSETELWIFSPITWFSSDVPYVSEQLISSPVTQAQNLEPVSYISNQSLKSTHFSPSLQVQHDI